MRHLRSSRSHLGSFRTNQLLSSGVWPTRDRAWIVGLSPHGCFLGSLRRASGGSFETLGASRGLLGPLWGLLGLPGTFFGVSWGLFWTSWVASWGEKLEMSVRVAPLKPMFGNFNRPFGPSWEPLGLSWGPLGLSWGSLGPSWGGLGGPLGRLEASDARKYLSTT